MLSLMLTPRTESNGICAVHCPFFFSEVLVTSRVLFLFGPWYWSLNLIRKGPRFRLCYWVLAMVCFAFVGFWVCGTHALNRNGFQVRDGAKVVSRFSKLKEGDVAGVFGFRPP